MDGASRLWCLDGDISPQELVVAKGDSTRSNDTYYILVQLPDSMMTPVLSHLLGCGPVWF